MLSVRDETVLETPLCALHTTLILSYTGVSHMRWEGPRGGGEGDFAYNRGLRKSILLREVP